MWRILPLMLLLVVGCSRTRQVIEPEEIDVCPVLADQMEGLLDDITDFIEVATIEDLEADGGIASEFRERGRQLSERATDLGCDPAEVRAAISTSSLRSDDPIAQLFIDLVIESLAQS